MSERKLSFAVYASFLARYPEWHAMTWEQFCAFVTGQGHRLVQDKKRELPAMSPVVPRDPRAPRGKSNVKALSMLCVDFDGLTEAQVNALLVWISDKGWACLVWTTFSHDPASGLYRLRVVFPLSRDVSAEDWPRFYAEALEGQPYDPSCADVARLHALPGSLTPVSGEIAMQPGTPVDVDAVLATAPPAESKRASPAHPSVANGEAQDRLDELAETLSPLCGEMAFKHQADGRPLYRGTVCPLASSHLHPSEDDDFHCVVSSNGWLYIGCGHQSCAFHRAEACQADDHRECRREAWRRVADLVGLSVVNRLRPPPEVTLKGSGFEILTGPGVIDV